MTIPRWYIGDIYAGPAQGVNTGRALKGLSGLLHLEKSEDSLHFLKHEGYIKICPRKGVWDVIMTVSWFTALDSTLVANAHSVSFICLGLSVPQSFNSENKYIHFLNVCCF